jgi:hypothetical protein
VSAATTSPEAHRVWPNRFAGPCAGRQDGCDAFVDAGEGGVLPGAPPGPKHLVYCGACLARRGYAVPSGEDVAVTLVGRTRFALVTRRYLTPEKFERLKGACAGVGARRSPDLRGGSYVERARAGELVAELVRLGLRVALSEAARLCLESDAERRLIDAEGAKSLADTVDERLAKRGLKLYPFQKVGFEWLALRDRGLLCDQQGLGKEQPVSALVMTPNGPRTIGSLVVGDLVSGSDGRPTRVTGVFPRGTKPVFRVTLDDGSSTRAGAEHLWCVATPYDRQHGKTRVLDTAAMIAWGLEQSGGHRFAIPLAGPVEFTVESQRPLHPYLLGALLANGTFAHSVLHTGLPGQRELLAQHLPAGIELSPTLDEWSYRLSSGQAGRPNEVVRALKALGLFGKESHERFVPWAYMVARVIDRVALLQGLFDNDGTVSADGATLEYNTTSSKLAGDVLCLARGLGLVAWESQRPCVYKTPAGERVVTGKTDHRVRFGLPDGFAIARLPEKRDRVAARTKYPAAHYVDAIELEGEEECVCISVEAADGLYVTDDFILTHNTCQSLMALPSLSGKRQKLPPALVVCKGIAKDNWEAECLRWRPDYKPVVLSGVGSFRWPAPGEVVIVNYEIQPAVEDMTVPPAECVLVVDEAQAAKNPKAKRTVRLRAMAEMVRNVGGKNWVLTGTPLMNRMPELWAVAQVAGLGAEAFGSYKRFKSLCGVTEEPRPCEECGHLAPHEPGRGCIAKKCGCALEELPTRSVWGSPSPEVREGFERIALRRLRAEVLPDLPGKSYQDHPVRLSKEQKRDVDAELAPGWESAIEAAMETRGGVAFTEMSAARKLLAEAKVGAALELAEQFGENAEPLVVFSCHSAPLEALSKLGGWALVDGSVSPKQRTEAIADFQAGRLAGLACNIDVAGTSITLTRACHALFVDQKWSPTENEQAEDRLARIGQARGVLIHRLVADHALDRRVAELLDQKRGLIQAAIEKPGGGA